jgi:hypothetical protein
MLGKQAKIPGTWPLLKGAEENEKRLAASFVQAME